ncbi:hypothetical protein GCM10012285_61390 [Streptomyces kronopolitis]|uniref:Uncharacterized protein n=1 Tax=Streptomyces kronopolitis TaxID=1612435 RepID=A0ABQ2K4A6_9ACTN|nr:hypothetical protein [Streptomyces kronopolitis]GGN61895.1 hypothetical protein GCM10012285_61390 [Streptomyces kronopolitis]
MAFFGLVGNDQKLASTTYSDRESASERAARRRREGHHRSAAAADRQGQAWADAERARQDRGSRWRR